MEKRSEQGVERKCQDNGRRRDSLIPPGNEVKGAAAHLDWHGIVKAPTL